MLLELATVLGLMGVGLTVATFKGRTIKAPRTPAQKTDWFLIESAAWSYSEGRPAYEQWIGFLATRQLFTAYTPERAEASLSRLAQRRLITRAGEGTDRTYTLTPEGYRWWLDRLPPLTPKQRDLIQRITTEGPVRQRWAFLDEGQADLKRRGLLAIEHHDQGAPHGYRFTFTLTEAGQQMVALEGLPSP